MMNDKKYEEELQKLVEVLSESFSDDDGSMYLSSTTGLVFLSIMNKLKRLATQQGPIGHYISTNFGTEIMSLDNDLLNALDHYPELVDEFAKRNLMERNGSSYPEIAENFAQAIKARYSTTLTPDQEVIDQYKTIAAQINHEYVAIDYNGSVYSYEIMPNRPVKEQDVWTPNISSDYRYLGNIFYEDKFDADRTNTDYSGKHITNSSELLFDV